MRRFRRQGRRFAIVAVLSCAAAFSFALVASSGRSADPQATVAFQTVPAAKIASGGIVLTPVEGPAPPGVVGAAAATAVFGQRRVLETHYAHCVDTESPALLNQDCWAVSLDPSGLVSNGPVGATPQTATFLLAFIDPASGKLIEAFDGH